MTSDKAKKKPINTRGQVKAKPDNDNPEKNPLLHVENKAGFEISTGNLLQDPSSLIFEMFDDFDVNKEQDHFDMKRLNDNSIIVIVLRYYEYICTASVRFSYIIPIMKSGLIAKDVFDMLKHCLKNKLLMNVPSFDVVFEPDVQYYGKIKY